MKSDLVTIPTISPSDKTGMAPIFLSIKIFATSVTSSSSSTVIKSLTITVDTWKCEGAILPYLAEPNLLAISFSEIIPTKTFLFSLVLVTGILDKLSLYIILRQSHMFKFLSIDTTFSDIIFLIFIITPTIKSNEIAIRKNPNESIQFGLQ